MRVHLRKDEGEQVYTQRSETRETGPRVLGAGRGLEAENSALATHLGTI